MKRAFRPFLALGALVALTANLHAQQTVTFCDGAANCIPDTLEGAFEDGSALIADAPAVGTEVPYQVVTDTQTAAVQGWSYGVKHDTAVLSIVEDSATTLGTIAHPDSPNSVAINPYFDATQIVPGGFISAVVLSLLEDTELPIARSAICNATYTVDAEIPAGGTLIEIVSGEIGPNGSPPTDINITVDGSARLPTTLVQAQIGGGGPAEEICDNGVDDDGDELVDCDDDDCAEDPACETAEEICDNGVDDDEDGDVDCDDADCEGDPACDEPGEEICDNGVDDDEDGDVDCDDADCAGDPACETGACEAPDWAFYFGDAATTDTYAGGGDPIAVNMRNATDAFAFSLGISMSEGTLTFSSELGTDANRLVELIITDENGDTQTPETPNDATTDLMINQVTRGAAISGFADGDFFAFDADPGVGGPGLTVGYVSDLDGDENRIPATVDGDTGCALNEILILGQGEGGANFQRGDADGNGSINVSDAVWIIQVVVGNFTARFDCDDAFDANDDGEVNLSDALPVLAWIFQRGDRLADPFLACGVDSTPATSAGCATTHPACQ